MLGDGVTVVFCEGVTVLLGDGVIVVFCEGVTVTCEGMSVMLTDRVVVIVLEGVAVMLGALEGVVAFAVLPLRNTVGLAAMDKELPAFRAATLSHRPRAKTQQQKY